MDLDCPARILTAFVESWLSCGANDPIILEWVTEKCNDVMKEKDSICKPVDLHHLCAHSM